jgi:hypothetical protein
MKVKGVWSDEGSCAIFEIGRGRLTEAKRRRQGLVVCRAALPFEGLEDARPGVTLAPSFCGPAAVQSVIVRR